MQELITRGGPVMYPIIAGSIIGLGIFLERLWGLQRSRVLPGEFADAVRRLAQEGKTSEAAAVCEQNHSSMARVFRTALRQLGRPREQIKEAVELTGKIEVAVLEKYVGLVGLIATLEPLLGLLGTVLGLITAFQRIEQAGVMGDAKLVAGGVWEALITTAAGLVVAIPAMLAYRYLRARIRQLVLEMEEIAFDLVDTLTGPQPAPVNGSAVPQGPKP